MIRVRRCVTKAGVLVALLAAWATVLLVASCDGGGGEPSPSPTSVATPTPPSTPGFSFEFEGPIGIDLTTFGAFYDQGKAVHFAVAVAVREPMTLYYRTSQRYDLAVIDPQGQEVWRLSRHRDFAQVAEEVQLETDQMLTSAETWDQRGDDGQQVPPGNYQVVAESSHCEANNENCGQLTTSRTIQIRASAVES